MVWFKSKQDCQNSHTNSGKRKTTLTSRLFSFLLFELINQSVVQKPKNTNYNFVEFNNKSV